MKHFVTIALLFTALALTTGEALAKKERAQPDRLLLGVTAIKGVKNYYPNTIYIRSTEMGRGYDIFPNSPNSGVDIWIPWATNREQFESHHIWIEIPKGTLKHVIWQASQSDGDLVRCNNRRVFEDPGKRCPGYASVNGNRILIVKSDGSIEINHIASLRGYKARRSKRAKLRAH